MLPNLLRCNNTRKAARLVFKKHADTVLLHFCNFWARLSTVFLGVLLTSGKGNLILIGQEADPGQQPAGMT